MILNANELLAGPLLRDGCPRCGSLTRMVGDLCVTCFDELVDDYDRSLRESVGQTGGEQG